MKIINVVGARPNFMKIAPIVHEMRKYKYKMIEQILVHTGQHYDSNMSSTFFRNLEIPEPDIYLNVGSGTHAVQTACIMRGFEKVLLRKKPDLVLVVGDVNSTLACSLTATKLHIKVGHVEAGLRSFDQTMPEEVNRVLTDHISGYLFTSCEGANKNLLREGIDEKKIHFVGNVMIDSLLQYKCKAEESTILFQLGLVQLPNPGISHTQVSDKPNELNNPITPYAVLTLHRPSNVDDKKILRRILEGLNGIAKDIRVIFPIHPRTKKRIREFKYEKYFRNNITITDPLGYIDFLKLHLKAKFVLTDSGGIQEEATVLGIPCITLRENTERPITIAEGTNYLVGTDVNKMINIAKDILNNKSKKGKIPKYWDGKAAERIIKVLLG